MQLAAMREAVKSTLAVFMLRHPELTVATKVCCAFDRRPRLQSC